MEPNPYQSPPPEAIKGRWRLFWRWLCIRSFFFALFLIVPEAAMRLTKGPTPDALHLVLDGLLALIELMTFTTIGIAGIGWIISPRPRP